MSFLFNCKDPKWKIAATRQIVRLVGSLFYGVRNEKDSGRITIPGWSKNRGVVFPLVKLWGSKNAEVLLFEKVDVALPSGSVADSLSVEGLGKRQTENEYPDGVSSLSRKDRLIHLFP